MNRFLVNWPGNLAVIAAIAGADLCTRQGAVEQSNGKTKRAAMYFGFSAAAGLTAVCVSIGLAALHVRPVISVKGPQNG